MKPLEDDLTFLMHLTQGFAELQQVPGIHYEYNARQLVYQQQHIKLYHYEPHVKKPHRTPLLVIFATVNRPEILDLFPAQSFIGHLLQQGLDVYLLDWGYPTTADAAITLNDYITHFLHDCIAFMQKENKKRKIDVLGICQGGLISLCYAALFKDIRKLVLISTPIDFHTRDNIVGHFLNRIDVKQLIALLHNVPGLWLTHFFISLRPFELVGKKYLHFVDRINDSEWREKFLRVEKWLYDAPDQTGASFLQLADDFYRHNKLVKGELCIDGKRIDLSKLDLPILNVMASNDEIVPVSASRALKKYMVKTQYSECFFDSGHIGIYISDKVGAIMPKTIATWLKKA